MGALDASSLLLEFGNIWVGDDAASLVDLGAVRNVRFTAQKIGTKINSDNRGTLIDKARLNGMIEFDWLEPGDVSKLAELFKGLVTATTVAASPVSGATQTLASGAWNYNNFYKIENQMGDGTAPTINSVTGGTNGALSDGDGYHLGKNENGEWGIYLGDAASELTTESQAIVIDYDYTPNASRVLTGGSSQTATNRYIKIIGPSEDDASTTREIVISEGVVSSDMLIPFVNVEDAGDVGVMPVSIEANKASTWTFTDEVNPN